MKGWGQSVTGSVVFHFLTMAATTTPAVAQQTPQTTRPGAVAFDLSQPPAIEGFSPLSVAKDETFAEKFMRKTGENPFVPIGELHKFITR